MFLKIAIAVAVAAGGVAVVGMGSSNKSTTKPSVSNGQQPGTSGGNG